MIKPCYRVPNWIDPREAYSAYETLRDNVEWLNVAGNRLEYWTNTLGRSYTYGQGIGQRTYESKPSNSIVEFYRERLLNATGADFNACFINYYRDGTDSIGWHADDDPGIDHDFPIAVVTLGNGRRIEFKSNEKGSHPDGYFLENGSLFVMNPGMQLSHKHRIPKVTNEATLIQPIGPRISLTYRVLK